MPTESIELVTLDREHPGFRDPVYRQRRNEIARIALEYRLGAPIPEVAYTERENEVWRTALENLAPLHRRYACRAYLEYWPRMGFRSDRIAQLSEITRALAPLTGFSLSPVAGLVTPKVFLTHLADGVFLATQYVRHHSTPLYTPEPDVIHELVGHAALLAAPELARVNRLFGEAASRASDAQMEALIRTYWYTLEFGLTREQGALKVIGAGLLSSFGELQRFEAQAELRPLDLEEIARTPFDPTDYQRVLFVAESTEQLLEELERWLQKLIGEGPKATLSASRR